MLRPVPLCCLAQRVWFAGGTQAASREATVCTVRPLLPRPPGSRDTDEISGAGTVGDEPDIAQSSDHFNLRGPTSHRTRFQKLVVS